ncbi:MAG: hypothetical protein IAG10_25050, partial [Planctomycetaceae bacterium]|nr:hypothetical protein [Planctomycetaceae bacterium]
MKKRWLVAMTLLIGGLIVAALLLGKEPIRPEATLSDGTIVRFEKAGVGMIAYDSYPPLKAALAGYVPNRFQGRLGERIRSSFTIQPHAIGLLFSIWSADGKRKRESAQFLSRIEFVESTGFVFNQHVSGYSSSGGVMCISEESYPRRDPTLHMRLYDQRTEHLFDLHVPNPGYKPTFPEWTPEALPAIQTAAPLTVTLKNGLSNSTGRFLRDEDFEIASTDQRWTDTRPQQQFWVTDATGNRAYVQRGLSPFEPAWKLHLRVRRNAAAEFGAGEVFRTKLLPLPSALKAERLNQRQVVAGVELTATILSSAGDVRDDGTSLTVAPTSQSKGGTGVNRGSINGLAYANIDSSLPFFSLNYSTHDDDTELIVTVRDQTGRKVSVENPHGSSGMNGVWTR